MDIFKKVDLMPLVAIPYVHLFITFAKIGLLSFGGGNGMLEILRYNTVEGRSWVTLEEFNLITGVSIALPGLNALNIACIIGYKVAGLGGAVVSLLAISIPSLLIVVLFYNLMLNFLTPAQIKIFEVIVQYAIIALVANIIYSTYNGLVLQDAISPILLLLGIALFVAIAILKIDTTLALLSYLVIALLFSRWW